MNFLQSNFSLQWFVVSCLLSVRHWRHTKKYYNKIFKKKDETSLPEASLLPILVWEEKEFILARHEVKSVDEI